MLRSDMLPPGVPVLRPRTTADWRSRSSAHHAARLVARALRTTSTANDRRWTAWATDAVAVNTLDPAVLEAVWCEIVHFDEILAHYLTHPVPVPDGTVIVTGSGKETFKTYNVSTAAAVLAAAAGARVVKGVSSSVSAVSGSADVLSELGIPVLAHPGDITASVYSDRIAFVPYNVFCPRYAARYDGRFDGLSPMSFFMPTATIAVDTDRFVHGLAHHDVGGAATAITTARPTLTSGRVVTTWLSDVERVDEDAACGQVRTAVVEHGKVTVDEPGWCAVPDRWRGAVRHRDDHGGNALLLVESLSPRGDADLCDLTARNAEVILAVARPEMTAAEVAATVHDVRLSGAALRLLRDLRYGTGGKR